MKTLVLVGGTGSLGRAILKQQDFLKSHDITRIRILSRDEQKQALTEKEYDGSIPLQCFLGDVRNQSRMEFGLKNSEYVIHMAALKFIERFELDVEEGFETNIVGSKNVMKAFLRNPRGESGILVSTDKACNPINAYGVSKLAAQHIWLWANSFQHEINFGVCQYGNVLASRGSVIELWKKYAQEKRPLPVTHEEMTRFFITKDDAARFVLQSLFHNNRSIMVPPMKSIEMVKMADKINQIYDSDAGMKIIGLRDSREKMHEDLPGMNSFTAQRFTDEELTWMVQHA